MLESQTNETMLITGILIMAQALVICLKMAFDHLLPPKPPAEKKP